MATATARASQPEASSSHVSTPDHGEGLLRESEPGAARKRHPRSCDLGMRQVPRSTLPEAMNRRLPEMFKSLFD